MLSHVRFDDHLEVRELLDVPHQIRRRCRADPRLQAQHAQPGRFVLRVIGDAEIGQRIFDVRALEKLHAAAVLVWHVAFEQFEFQHLRVRGRTEQHRHVCKRHAL